MDKSKQAWHLMKGRARFGTLTLNRVEGGWSFCTFEPTPAFAAVQDTFEEEVILLEAEPLDEARWQRAARKIRQMHLALQPTASGPPLQSFLLHIDGDRAWFRVTSNEGGGSTEP